MYKVRLQVNDDRPHALVMREVYLDFYSKSLKEQEQRIETGLPLTLLLNLNTLE